MKKEIRQINLNSINPDPTQPRKDFDEEELQELANSIKQNGLLNPITVKSNNGDGEYTIIAGERRYRAHQILDEESIECIVFTGKNGKELQLVENINRKDLNPMEVVNAYRSYLDAGHTVEDLAMVVGKPKNIISWLLNLENCRPDVQHMVSHNQMSMVVGISMSKLTENGQAQALRTMHSTQLSVSDCQILSQNIFDSMTALVESFVETELKMAKVKRYTLTWESSDEYLKYKPVQISMFGEIMKEAKC